MKTKLLSVPALLVIMLNFYCKRNTGGEVIPSSKIKTIGAVSLASILPGQFAIIAGQYNSAGYTDGNRTKARFNFPMGIFVNADGSLLVADFYNNSIRKIKSDTLVTTLHFPNVKQGDSFAGARPFDVAETKDGAIGITGDILAPDD